MIKLIILDVDGCLSDGKLIYSADAIESKNFNVKDGLGITTWLKTGNSVAVITGRKSDIVQKRVSELGIPYLFQGIKDKKKIMLELLKELKLQPHEVAVIGDDLNDYSMLKYAGRSFTPNDGVTEIKKIVNSVLSKNGGDGAVREMIDMLVIENNQTDKFLSVWIKD